MQCPKCGKDTPDLAITCDACGATLAQASTDSPTNTPAGLQYPPPVAPSVQPMISGGSETAQPPKTNGLAITSLVLGIIGACTLGVGSLVGLILGIIAIGQINNSQGRQTGQGLAISGIVLSVVLPLLLVPAILFPVFGKAREKARQTQCVNNQKQIATATLIYIQEYEEQLPPADTYWDVIHVDPSALKCVTAPKQANGYGIHQAICGKQLGNIRDENGDYIPADTIMLTADSNAPNNMLFSNTDIAYRHNDKAITSYLDGHVDMITTMQETGLAE